MYWKGKKKDSSILSKGWLIPWLLVQNDDTQFTFQLEFATDSEAFMDGISDAMWLGSVTDGV
jgi:hypothetical protein